MHILFGARHRARGHSGDQKIRIRKNRKVQISLPPQESTAALVLSFKPQKDGLMDPGGGLQPLPGVISFNWQ